MGPQEGASASLASRPRRLWVVGRGGGELWLLPVCVGDVFG